jgi:hypothetical protein
MYYVIGAGKLSIYSDPARTALEAEDQHKTDATAHAALLDYLSGRARERETWVVVRATRDGSAGSWTECSDAEEAHRIANGPHPHSEPGTILGPDGSTYMMPRATLDRFLSMVRR